MLIPQHRRVPQPQFEGSMLIFAVMIAFVAIAFVQLRGGWTDAERGLFIFERTQADAVIDVGLIARAQRVRAGAPLAERLAEETVMVQRRTGRHAYVGAGVVVASNAHALHVLTARHVVEHSGRLVIAFRDGTLEDASVVRQSQSDDLALLAVRKPAATSVAVARLGSQDFATGDAFVVMGHPGRRNWAATAGLAERHLWTTLLFCPGCDRGDSGAGAFDMHGRLRGIVVKKLTILSPGTTRGRQITAFTTERPDRLRALLRE